MYFLTLEHTFLEERKGSAIERYAHNQHSKKNYTYAFAAAFDRSRLILIGSCLVHCREIYK